MKDPVFQQSLSRLTCMVWLAFSAATLAESPEPGSRHGAARTRPQVIYHLPPASDYAATLHSQAKTASNEVPAEGPTPVSLQTPRPSPNASVALEQAFASPRPERTVKPQVHSNRSHARPRSFNKPANRGNGHGNKSHRK